jgi:predicted nucleotidyltransferase
VWRNRRRRGYTLYYKELCINTTRRPPAGPAAADAALYNRLVDVRFDQRIVEVCGAQPGIVAVYLFGSTARATAHGGSDVDVAVLFARTPPPRLASPRFDLEGDLDRALGRHVDMVVLNDAPVDLRTRVLRDGRLLIDNDPAVRIAFEVRTRNEAFDLEPILARYRAPRGPSR